MAGIRVIQLQEIKPASPLHRRWIKHRRGGDIVPELRALFFLRPVPLGRWKGSWLIDITWIGNDVRTSR
ncbi:MAG TPA: hypothetical protein VF478_03175 [Anaerolineae bacterium]